MLERSTAAYADALWAAAAEAGRRTGWVEHDVAVASHRIRLRFAGDELAAALCPALSPILRAPEAAAPAAVVHACDGRAAGVAAPGPPWEADEVLGRGEVRGRPGLAQDANSGAVSSFDAASGRGVFWVDGAGRLPWYERAAPFRALLNWLLAGAAGRLAHAGAVGGDRAGVLIAGRGGSGKSTLALACARAGLAYAGDDYVYVSTAGEPRAHALYSTAKGDARTLDLVGGLVRAFEPLGLDGEKAVIAIDRVSAHVPVSAIVLPRVTAGRPRLAEASGAEALLALAPSTIFQLPATGSPLAALAELARSVPAFRLETGADPAAAAETVAELVGRL